MSRFQKANTNQRDKQFKTRTGLTNLFDVVISPTLRASSTCGHRGMSLFATSSRAKFGALLATLVGGSSFGRFGLKLLSQLTPKVGRKFLVVFCELAQTVLGNPVVPAVTSKGLAMS